MVPLGEMAVIALRKYIEKGYLLEVGHVATVGGDAFGSPECFRMSYATSDENIVEAMRRIKGTLARLK